MNVAERIKQYRLKAGMSQAELAKKIGTTPQNISQYERGIRNPKYDTLRRISVALDVSLELLLTPEEQDLYIIGGEEGEKFALWAYRKFNNYSFDKDEQLLIDSFSLLNSNGKKVAIERVEELTEIPKYQRKPGDEEDE